MIDDPAIEEMGLEQVRELIRRLLHIRLSSPLTGQEQVLWDKLAHRERLLLGRGHSLAGRDPLSADS